MTKHTEHTIEEILARIDDGVSLVELTQDQTLDPELVATVIETTETLKTVGEEIKPDPNFVHTMLHNLNNSTKPASETEVAIPSSFTQFLTLSPRLFVPVALVLILVFVGNTAYSPSSPAVVDPTLIFETPKESTTVLENKSDPIHPNILTPTEQAEEVKNPSVAVPANQTASTKETPKNHTNDTNTQVEEATVLESAPEAVTFEVSMTNEAANNIPNLAALAEKITTAISHPEKAELETLRQETKMAIEKINTIGYDTIDLQQRLAALSNDNNLTQLEQLQDIVQIARAMTE